MGTNYTPAEGQVTWETQDLTLVWTDPRSYTTRNGIRWDGKYGVNLIFSMMIGARSRIMDSSKMCDGRLTLETGVAVSTSNQTAKTTLYFTPHNGDRIGLYDGTNWKVHTFTERSIGIPATTDTNYDVFLYDNAGTLTLELLAWTNDTTRATAITLQNGVYVKSGATTRRYLGSIRTTGVSGNCEDSDKLRLLWNYYNRTPRTLNCHDSTDSWSQLAGGYLWREINGGSTLGTSRFGCVIGVSEDPVKVKAHHSGSNDGNDWTCCGIGVDGGTTTNSANVWNGESGLRITNPIAKYNKYPGIGYRTFHFLEQLASAGTSTWYGDNGATQIKTGMQGEVLG